MAFKTTGAPPHLIPLTAEVVFFSSQTSAPHLIPLSTEVVFCSGPHSVELRATSSSCSFTYSPYFPAIISSISSGVSSSY